MRRRDSHSALSPKFPQRDASCEEGFCEDTKAILVSETLISTIKSVFFL